MEITINSVNASGTTLLSNATTTYKNSVLSLNLGLTQFRLLYKGAAISRLYGVVDLKPGSNDMQTLGTAAVTDLVSRPDLIQELAALAKGGQDIPVTIQGYENLNARWANSSIQALAKNTTLSNKDFISAVSTLGPAVLSVLGL